MMLKSFTAIFMLFFSASAFAARTVASLDSKICADKVVAQFRQQDSYSDYDVRGSFPVKAGEGIIIEADEFQTNLKRDSEAIVIEEKTMGVLMNVHVIFVNPANCKFLERFAVPAGM